MAGRWNELQWRGEPGHYEVYYLTLTDPATGIGFWIRYTMVAPLQGRGEPSCSLWLMAMDPSTPAWNVAAKATFPIAALSAREDPFELKIADAVLSDTGMQGSMDSGGRTFEWRLEWSPSLPAYGHVHPVLRAAKIAKTVLFLPHPDVELRGTITVGERQLDVTGARAGQAHLWGLKHATRWAWAHCSDFADGSGRPRRNGFFDGVSVYVPRLGREVGPSTPVVARVGDEDVLSISPLAVTRNRSEIALDSWSFEATTATRKLRGEVSARVADLVGVTYHDPDGELAYCYNTEVADMRLELLTRERPWSEWTKEDELRSSGRAHFEYAQRSPVEGVEVKV